MRKGQPANYSPEVLARISKGWFKKGHIQGKPFQKGQVSLNKGKKMSEEQKAKLSAAKLGRHPAWMDSDKKEEIIEKIAASQRGEKSFHWKGGLTPINKRIRNSMQYKKWRRAVLARDGECVLCGADEKLQVDHIKPFAHYPESRFDVNNGRVLCVSCHEMTPTFGGRSIKLSTKTYG